MRTTLLLLGALTACGDGPQSFSARGVPQLDAQPTLTATPSVVVDGTRAVRAGAEITLDLPVSVIEGLD